MATATLNAQARAAVGKGAARKLRAARQVPGVIYGHNRQPQPLTLDAREIERVLERVSAETTVFELAIDGATARTLIREIQRDPIKSRILHIDFQELVAGEAVEVNVPIIAVGSAAGVRAGGILDQIMREVLVRVDPANIPNHIDVDVNEVGLNQSLHVSDLKVPPGVEILEDEDATILVVLPPRAEAEPAPAPEAVEAPAEPELIRKPKAGEEEGETEGE